MSTDGRQKRREQLGDGVRRRDHPRASGNRLRVHRRVHDRHLRRGVRRPGQVDGDKPGSPGPVEVPRALLTSAAQERDIELPQRLEVGRADQHRLAGIIGQVCLGVAARGVQADGGRRERSGDEMVLDGLAAERRRVEQRNVGPAAESSHFRDGHHVLRPGRPAAPSAPPGAGAGPAPKADRRS